ncbi:MAG: hypothetical protein AB7S38_16005 [Vulcanimicrobiota bacterium]
MKQRKKLIPLLLTLVLATFALSQAKEEFKVLIDGNRNAAVKISTDEGQTGTEGTIKASIDLPKGESVLDLNLDIEDAKQLGDGSMLANAKVNSGTLEVVGSADIPVPAEDAPEKLTASIESVTQNDVSVAKADLALVTKTPEKIPTVKLDANGEGSVKAFKGGLTYSVKSDDGDLKEIPFNNLVVAISEAEDKTTIELTISAPPGEFANQLKMLPQAKDPLEQNLRQAQIEIEKIEFPEVEETPQGNTARATLVLKNVRATLHRAIDAFGPNMGSPEISGEVMAQAFNNIVEVRLNKFQFTMEVKEGEVSGALEGDLSQVDKFFEGYLTIMPAVLKTAKQQQNFYQYGEAAPIVEAFYDINMQNGLKMIRLMLDSPLDFKGSGSLNMSKTEDKMSLDAKADLSTEGYEEFVKKAKEQGIPVAEKALLLGDLQMESNRLVGKAYMYTDGDLISYYKGMLIGALGQAGAAEAQDIVKQLEIKESEFNLNLTGSKLTIKGYGETTDLTPAVSAILKKGAAQLEGTLVGVKMDFTFKPDGSGAGEPVTLYFKDFMPGKSEDQIKKALSFPSSATVTADAASSDVTLVAVEKPALEMDPKLAAIQSEAQAKLGSTAVAAGATSGSKSWMMILAGVLILGLIGVGLAAGKKSA